ncbi:hypothetical protein BDP27DRAFT_1362153 [Rhodocollybia butyracea]|uniref:Uncharacterized protein n=1 Tax=Rhodocollybia butyracea TaxID=206335 RepID=A0A9P5U9F0_9AGAR|nr:hypothetical protein BDP27DRAFT_1362153 [Rhodocollybia butyracea]
MKTFTLLTQLAASVSVIMAQFGPAPSFEVDTPASLTQCEPVVVEWSGGTPPYDLYSYPPSLNTSEVCGDGVLSNRIYRVTPFSVYVITELGSEVNATSFKWVVNIPAGQVVGFDVTDAAGSFAQSGVVTIQPGKRFLKYCHPLWRKIQLLALALNKVKWAYGDGFSSWNWDICDLSALYRGQELAIKLGCFFYVGYCDRRLLTLE